MSVIDLRLYTRGYTYAKSTYCRYLASKQIHRSLSTNREPLYAASRSDPTNKPKQNDDRTITNPNLLRNIGIIAHINAGKTTTTERILYHAGSTDSMGDVDMGNTVTDYLEQERDRGITITSAAVTYYWKKHQVNLIDTPGHVDFTFEVERSLSVVDGALTILDASSGVEAQTVTVWNQAIKYHLPNVIFLNKYDKPGADYKMCLLDLRRQLNIRAGLIYLPIKPKQNESKSSSSSELLSLIDIINGTVITWIDPKHNNGSQYRVVKLFETDHSHQLDKRTIDKYYEERENLVNNLADLDESFANHVIDCDKLSSIQAVEIQRAIRQTTLSNRFSPVLVGSSFRYIGVQQLMDAILAYLPSPMEHECQILNQIHQPDRSTASKLASSSSSACKENEKQSNKTNTTCLFIFKITHHKRLGPLSYVRVYNGQLVRGQNLINLNTKKREIIKRIYRPFADDLTGEISPDQVVSKSDIVILAGLIESRTGDILVSNLQTSIDDDELMPNAIENNDNNSNKKQNLPYRLLALDSGKILVPKIEQMEPVYFCTLEAASTSQQIKLEQALINLAREDPSFVYEIDSLGVGTLRGQGKLHLEIIRDRIATEYSLSPILGPMQIAYRETVAAARPLLGQLELDRIINGQRNVVSIKLALSNSKQQMHNTTTAASNSHLWLAKQLKLDSTGALNNGDTQAIGRLARLRHDHRKAISLGLQTAMMHGPTLGYPLIGCELTLVDFKCNQKCTLAMISSAASQCLTSQILNSLTTSSGGCNDRSAENILLEPIMQLELIVPSECAGQIANDLNCSRRGQILKQESLGDDAIAENNNNNNNKASFAFESQRRTIIRAKAPLASLADYAEFLRVTSSGRASFSMELHDYVAMSESDKRNIIRI